MSAGGEQLLRVLAENAEQRRPVGPSPATVVAVTPRGPGETGPDPSDGFPVVTVRWRGADVVMPYLEHYTPVVGHVVLVEVDDTRMTILGRIVGSPA